ncbi:iron permease, FTR1 family [Crinalium epipsammum PCC 9333]|uniref:Iron permease, FTR1 family n=1 Tax=Crinalium epipsammum PCC 9333 TaxID=1173022 RepID=K9W4G5_9CYAN|nr:FTR1 family protein [Crinalium epipsammum]AFZ15076.1 iron permease, FTR1 family [Crinalium epipsammum PCC 9333]
MTYLKRLHLHRWQRLLALFLSMMIFVIAVPIYASNTPQQDLNQLNFYVDRSLSKAQAKDYKASQAAYEKFQQKWLKVEDRVKKVSPQAEQDIEKQISEVKVAFSTKPPNQAKLVAAIKNLNATNNKFINGGFKSNQPTKAIVNQDQRSLAYSIERLNRAEVALNKKDLATAVSQMKSFKTEWLDVKGIVATKSPDAYFAIENNIIRSYGFLTSKPVDITGARSAIASLKKDLQPFATEPLKYNTSDATLILLTEKLETLLVLVALLGFLKKSGNANKIYSLGLGASAGLAAAMIAAVVIEIFFSNAGGNIYRELLQGITGLAAAVMLFYTSFWLHMKSSIITGQEDIQDKINTIATNSGLFFGMLAFLAVFKEGAETTLSYINISWSMSSNDLLTGLGFGLLSLIAIAALILVVGLRLPTKLFFPLTSLLIFYLGFKFVGSGIHALQVADILPVSPANFLPVFNALSLYSTWETTLSQLVLIAIAIAVVMYTRFQNNRVTKEIPSEQQTVSENS